MRRCNLFCFTLSMFVVVSLLGGCSGGDGNKEGQQPPPLSTAPGAILPDGNLQADIQGVAINSRPVVTFKLLDENGAPLDPKTTGLSVRFFLARIKDDGNYENYVGDAAGFPSYDATGTFAALGNGVYAYTFATDINDATKTLKGITYSATDTRTHTAALQVSRTVASKTGASFQQARNVRFDFRPDGQAVTTTREIVAVSACNDCHGKLGVHGGGRRDTALCILCHNPDLLVGYDANGSAKYDATGVSFDFKVMIHKIHMGKKLPGNVAAIAAGGTGYGIGNASYAAVAYPLMSGDSKASGTPIECAKCHRHGTDSNGHVYGKDADRWKKAPTVSNCTTCHDTTTFNAAAQIDVADALATVDPGAGTISYKAQRRAVNPVRHTGDVGFFVFDETFCRVCHPAEVTGNNSYRMSITGHHTVLEQSSVYTGLNFVILSVTDALPGRKPVVTFRITDNLNNALSPAAVGSSFALRLGYLRQADYVNDGMGSAGQPLSQPLETATANGDGSFTITFATAIPTTATGTGVVGMEGRSTYTIPATQKYAARTVGVGGKSIQYFFDLATGSQVSDPARQRRISVAAERCNNCHGRLGASLHDASRANNTQQCVICHNPNATTGSGAAEQTINLKDFIHKLHTGENLALSGGSFTIGSKDFSKVKYPRDRRDCLACHVDGDPPRFALPLPANVLGSTTAVGADPNNAAVDDNVRTTPMKAACLSCHDNISQWSAIPQFGILVHVPGNATDANGAELCLSCHRTGLLQSPDLAHRPVR
ncbi:MAG: OmcA/MtrC family decaheme c-type cytochrome [Syntrophales bacterium]